MDFKWKTLLFCLIVAGYALAMVAFYPSIRNETDKIEELLDIYPENLMEAFGADTSSFSTIEGFMSVEYFSFVWVIIMAILIFSLGASNLAGEINDNTAAFTYTLPVKRFRLYLEKFIGTYLIATIVTLVTIIATIAGIYIIDETPNYGGFALFFLVGSGLNLFLLSLSTMFSTMTSSRGKVYGAMSFVFISSYLLHVLSGISSKVEDLYFLSFMKYYGDTHQILANTEYNYGYLIVLILSSVIFLGIGTFLAEKRDL